MADFARGQRLRELRERKHESQETVAFALGVSTKTVRTWEKGGRIRWPNAKRLAEHFGADPETLVSRELPEPVAEAGESQLDRIEAKLDRALDLLARAQIVRLANESDPPESHTPPAAGHRRTSHRDIR